MAELSSHSNSVDLFSLLLWKLPKALLRAVKKSLRERRSLATLRSTVPVMGHLVTVLAVDAGSNL